MRDGYLVSAVIILSMEVCISSGASINVPRGFMVIIVFSERGGCQGEECVCVEQKLISPDVYVCVCVCVCVCVSICVREHVCVRSGEHTSELQSHLTL